MRAALFVGSGVYEDTTLSRLRTPEADVRALADVMGDPRIGGFDSVRELLDEPETAVRRAIGEFFQDRSPDDLLLLYFSGHGVKDDRGRLYLAMRDTRWTQLKATAIAASYVVEHMDECRSKRQILILDCCNSGAFASGTKGSGPAMTASTFEGNGFGRVVLTASDSTQYALEGDRVIEQAEHSLFTHYLLEGLRTGAAAAPDDETISLDQWYEYAYQRTVASTPRQTPRKWAYNQQGTLVIARNPNPRAPTTADLPKELLETLVNPLPWARAGLVPELARLAGGVDRRLALAATAALRELAQGDDSLKVREAATAALAAAGQDVAGSEGVAVRAADAPAAAPERAPVPVEPTPFAHTPSSVPAPPAAAASGERTADAMTVRQPAPVPTATPSATRSLRIDRGAVGMVARWVLAWSVGVGATAWLGFYVHPLVQVAGEGVLVGGLLWFLLRHTFPRVGLIQWLGLVTLAAVARILPSWAGGLALLDGYFAVTGEYGAGPVIVAGLVGGAAFGAVLGMGASRLLSRSQWIGYGALGWTVAYVIRVSAFSVLMDPYESFLIPYVVSSFFMGLTFAAITGAAMLFRRAPVPAAEEPRATQPA